MGRPSVGCDGCRAGDAHDSDGTTGFLLGRVKNAKEGEQAGSTVENRADNTAGSHHLSIERRTVGYEGWARMQSTTELLSSISAQAEGERIAAPLLANKLSAMSF